MQGARRFHYKIKQFVITLLAALACHVATAATTASFSVTGLGIADIAQSGQILFTNAVRNGSTTTALNAFGGITSAVGISSDGTVIAGNGTPPTGQFYRGWIKNGNGPYIDIGTLGGDRTYVSGMSDDGKFITGVSFNAQSEYQGFRWSQAAGMQPIPFFPNSTQVMGSTGISGDGKVIAGTAYVVDDRYDAGFVARDCAGECGPLIATYQQAFLWTEAGGTVSLGSLDPPAPGVGPHGLPNKPYDTYTTAISADGKTVVGYSTSSLRYSGFIWRADTGIQALPGLPDSSLLFFPLAVSGDGSVVVGRIGGSCGTDCFLGPGAVVWDAVHETRLLSDVLTNDYGLGNALAGKFLEHATFISADGLTIAGYSDVKSKLGSWLVTLPTSLVPEPSSLALFAMGIFWPELMIRSKRKSI